ncbi:MAG: hypothetical protein IJQ71_03790 [Clostridia bacterium]|nr:hypothetical protein [Clostridia bacterium]
MKKLLSLILAVAMMMTIVPALAETGTEAGGLSSLLSGLGESSGDSSGESSGDTSSLTGLLGGLLGGGSGLDLSALGKTLVQKLKDKLGDLKGVDLDAIVSGLKDKLGGLLGGLKDKLGGLTKSGAEETTTTETGESSGDMSSLTSLLGSLGESSGETGATGETSDADILSLLGGLLGGETGTTGETGSASDLEALMMLGSLLGGSEGEGEGTEDIDLDSFLESFKLSEEYQEYVARYAAIQEHLNLEHADGLPAGDEQVMSLSEIYDSNVPDNPDVIFGLFTLMNYKKSEDGKELKALNSAGSVEILTLEKQEDGTFRVLEAATARDEDFEADLKVLCETYGTTTASYEEAKKWQIFDLVADLYSFMAGHPEYEKIEFQGEMLSAEDLDKMMEQTYNELEASVAAAK